MKLWHLRRLYTPRADEGVEKVVRAQSSHQARSIANIHTGDEGSIWTDKDQVSCTQLKYEGDATEIISDFLSV